MDFNLNTKENKGIWFSFRKLVFSYIFLISIVFTPVITSAGVLTFLADFFSGQDASAQTETVIKSSSQDMSLPEPATNFDPIDKIAGDIIIDGGEALLPEVGPSNEAPEKVNTNNGQISIYIVRSGDTLAGIATMFDVSVNTIMWANDLTKGSALKIGQTLVILPITGVMYTVTSGDTLNSIAKRFSGDVNEIANFNDLQATDKISIGDIILIPDGQVSSSIRPSAVSGSSAKAVTTSNKSYDGYYIKPFIGGHKTQGIHGYNAVDYGLPVGSELYASAAGTVIVSKNSGWNGGYGNYVVIQHRNNTQTVYGHMSRTIVSVGQNVTQGQIIGYSGNSGNSTGPHLHFEIRGAKNPF